MYAVHAVRAVDPTSSLSPRQSVVDVLRGAALRDGLICLRAARAGGRNRTREQEWSTAAVPATVNAKILLCLIPDSIRGRYS